MALATRALTLIDRRHETAWRRADAPCERRPVNQNCLSSDALVTCPALAGWPDGSEFESQRHLNQPPVRANQGVADPAKAAPPAPQFRIGEDRGVGQIVEVGPILQLVALGEIEQQPYIGCTAFC